ncbi:hypothetical protein ACQCQ6_23590 [Ralstonia pseudosolanacearum]|uniref:Uncharacterized protein n=1 Tax=Ralstonia syzygii TaxID=28097 RepID=A0ABX7ZHP7_9RALS|nr:MULTISPECIES: hypothetical protein [Ralstonia]AZU56691.1 hypothetical protein CFM90_10995 [Ralstonia solanacearum]MCK4125655.1 hypothetical protein [Ralstonia pseudosolanacearum]MCK4139368.1 hypothetical protein [Ralstonia pseudosolanacearum]MDO3514888.1 hypothetical protein [Ralstonia pseudosolanacearum]MDO3518732.1 hypothetical protein [Ralstonia pseudosolanacearum]
MQSTYQVINTTNREAGFYGALRYSAAAAWPLAMVAISKATGAAPRVVRFFLDSAYGEQFGEEVLNAIALGVEGAINCVIEEWMSRVVDEQTAKARGIRPGPSYLVSLLIASAIEVRMLGDLA